MQTNRPSAPQQSMRIEHKWGFGMAPVKPQVAAARQAAVGRVLAYLSSDTWDTRGLLEQLLEDLPEVKGLFARTWRQDQWDWFTVWEQLGFPPRAGSRSLASALGHLRRQLRDFDPQAVAAAGQEILDLGAVAHLSDFLGGTGEPPDGLGFVYILSTRESPRMLKIGYTNRSVRERVQELNGATGLLVPFGARAVWAVPDAYGMESRVQALLAHYRVRRDREFFEIDFREAFALIDGMVHPDGEDVA